MLHVLADISVDPANPPAGILGWLQCLAWVVGIAGGCLWIWTMLRREPPLHREFASHADVESLERDIQQLEAYFEARGATNAKTSHESREKIYNSIRALEQSVAALRKENELFNQRLSHMDAKLDRLIERL